MKKTFVVFILIFSNFVFAQNTVRVYYQVESKTNTKPDTPTRIDVYILDIDTNTQMSKFYNATYKSIDSVYSKLAEISKLNGVATYDASKMKFPKFNIGVVDNGKDYEVFRVFDGDIYKYSEPKNIRWNIEKDIQKIDDYDGQKATAKVNGRDWEVFYTSQIPLSFGPYILGQLPGLVLSAQDSTGSYSFKMIGLEKNIKDDDFLPSAFNRAVKVSKSKYKKAFEIFKKDPAKKLKENIVTQPDGDYMKLANPLPAEYVKRKEKEWIEYYKENDNDIDKER